MMIDYILKNGFWICVKHSITIPMGLLLSILLARMTSLEIFGKYQLILSILSIVSIISMPGFNTSIISYVAKGFDGYYKNLVKIKFYWALLGIPILLFIGLYFYITQEYIISYSFFICSIIFPFIYGFNTWEALLIGKENFKITAKFDVIQTTFNALMIISVLFLFKNNLVIIILAYAFSFGLTNYVIYRKTLKYITTTSNKDKFSYPIQYGYFITKISTVNIMLEHIDKILIGYFIGIPELAIYSIGIMVTKKFNTGIKNFLSVVSPKIAQYNTLKWKYYIPIFLGSCVIALIMYIALPPTMIILFGEKYVDSIFLSQLAIIFTPFYILVILVKNHFIFYKRDKKILTKNTIIFPIIKLIFMIPLLYYFGITGLAFLVGFQHLIDLGILYIIYKKS